MLQRRSTCMVILGVMLLVASPAEPVAGAVWQPQMASGQAAPVASGQSAGGTMMSKQKS